MPKDTAAQAPGRSDAGPIDPAFPGQQTGSWVREDMLQSAGDDVWDAVPVRTESVALETGKEHKTIAHGTGRPRTLWQVLTGYRPGLTVALLGPDGSGKSTLAAGLAQASPLPVRAVYMGLWKGKGTDFPGRRLPGFDLTSRLLYAWRKYLIGQWHRRLGRLVIFDRYTYDALLPNVYGRRSKDRLYTWLLGSACPAPDLTFVLDISGQAMYERKHESSPESLEAQRRGYLALTVRIPRMWVIDASRPLATVQAEISERIWGHFLGRD
ncbi:MAG: nucleoside/nucleotide kinase family protein [Chloroflexota bacterium]